MVIIVGRVIGVFKGENTVVVNVKRSNSEVRDDIPVRISEAIAKANDLDMLLDKFIGIRGNIIMEQDLIVITALKMSFIGEGHQNLLEKI